MIKVKGGRNEIRGQEEEKAKGTKGKDQKVEKHQALARGQAGREKAKDRETRFSRFVESKSSSIGGVVVNKRSVASIKSHLSEAQYEVDQLVRHVMALAYESEDLSQHISLLDLTFDLRNTFIHNGERIRERLDAVEEKEK